MRCGHCRGPPDRHSQRQKYKGSRGAEPKRKVEARRVSNADIEHGEAKFVRQNCFFWALKLEADKTSLAPRSVSTASASNAMSKLSSTRRTVAPSRGLSARKM